jgi:hypothetical protein
LRSAAPPGRGRSAPRSTPPRRLSGFVAFVPFVRNQTFLPFTGLAEQPPPPAIGRRPRQDRRRPGRLSLS